MYARRSPAHLSPLLALLLVFAPLPEASAQGGLGRSCGNHHWEACEWCGQDAYQDIGWPEMNHDCYVELVDFALFAQDYGLSGTGLSGDFNADSTADLLDFSIFVPAYDQPVEPCVPCGLVPDGCSGTIRLSADLFDPAVDQDQIELDPGTPADLRVVVENCEGLAAVTWTLETSANVSILGSETYGLLEISSATAFGTPQDGSPLFVGGCSFVVADDAPAWIRLTSGSGTAWDLAWAQVPAGRKVGFPRIAHLGINGPPPPDSLGCQPSSVRATPHAPPPPRLLPCEPNPTRGPVQISLELHAPGHFDLLVCDLLGRIVRPLDSGRRGPGTVSLVWDGRDQAGRKVTPGVYWVRLRAGGRETCTPVVWLR